MISLKIAVDEQDKDLGNYFDSCRQDLIDFINVMDIQFDIDEIPSRLCNPIYIEQRILLLNSVTFLFVVYSHGEEKSFLVKGHPYIEESNCELFKNSLFYSTACLTGRYLGSQLVEKGSHTFIGYNNPIKVLPFPLREISVKCDNSGIKFFIQGNTIGEAFNLMRAFYSTEINRLLRQNDAFNAGILRNNKASLVIFGNKNLTIQDFIVNLN